MKIYDENGKLIEGNWELCKAIVTDYDKENPFKHTKIVEDTAVEVAKKYDVSYNDVVKTVELLSGVSL
jgi:HD superfamily phosphohydrolase YqeK